MYWILLFLSLWGYGQNGNTKMQSQKEMKKILIIGATGSLAQYVISEAKKSDNLDLTLFARNPAKLSAKLSEGCKIVQGDALKISDLKNAIAGQDIVYVNLAGDLDTMSRNIITAMKNTDVKRIVAISSIGIYDTPTPSILVPYKKLADNIETSGLDYTIIRPNWFTSADEINYHITEKPEKEVGGAVSRKSIADFVAKIFQNPELYKNKNVGISKL